LEAKIVGKTKIDRITRQQIRESCDILFINELIERKRKWDEHVTRLDAETYLKGHYTCRKTIARTP
jgi:hypothetical protein